MFSLLPKTHVASVTSWAVPIVSAALRSGPPGVTWPSSSSSSSQHLSPRLADASSLCRLSPIRSLVNQTGPTPTARSKRQTHEEVEHYLSNIFNLENRVALVTGATGGVGAFVCNALARSGADIVVTDVPQKLDACHALVEKIKGMGREAIAVAADVTDQASINEAVKQADAKFGKLDILICTAGILGEMQMPQDLTEDNWVNVMKTNLDGVFHTCKASYPLLKKSGSGRVVIMSSIAALHGYGPQAAYCASKGALLPLAKSLALAWAPDHINVNCVLPGAANTPFSMRILNNPEKVKYIIDRIPLKRLAEPEDFVGPILFLSSHGSDYITGTHIVVDGGGTARSMAQ